MSEEQFSFFEAENSPRQVDFHANRQTGLDRLAAFAPYTGKAYATRRNFDFGSRDRSNISALSPWIRHRLINEEEVLHAVLKQHSFKASEKFIQEIFWRSYFKGWLEQRPEVWLWYRNDLQISLAQLEKDKNLNSRYTDAILGKTGIDAFDFWARELVETGYLHNHARMWFASIWIFTLKLPWVLGADFFYRHLMDGDPASNTCSWRWVAGLHTKGKNYVATASNIEQFTNGRFSAEMYLNKNPVPFDEDREAKIIPMPINGKISNEPYILLLTEEDCLPETLIQTDSPAAIAGVLLTNERSPLEIGGKAKSFAKVAIKDALRRGENQFGCEARLLESVEWKDQLLDLAKSHNVSIIITAYAPVGPVAEQLQSIKEPLSKNGIELSQIIRNYDAMTWPHATKGFFKLKKQMPDFIQALGLA